MKRKRSTKRLGLIEISRKNARAWERWGKKIMSTYKKEASNTLKEEGLVQEHMFLICIGRKHYLGYFSEGKHLPANMLSEVNIRHKRLLDRSTIRRIAGKILYSLETARRRK